jgi:hypothetical protein
MARTIRAEGRNRPMVPKVAPGTPGDLVAHKRHYHHQRTGRDLPDRPRAAELRVDEPTQGHSQTIREQCHQRTIAPVGQSPSLTLWTADV